MTAEITIRANWSDMSTPDVYLSYGYHEISSLLEPAGTRPVLIEARSADGVVRLPLLLRPIDKDYWDATSSYGYGGPWIEGSPDYTNLRAVLDTWARDNRVVATFVRLNPVLENHTITSLFADTIEIGDTVFWPTPPEADLLSAMKKKHRQYARKGEREGLQARVTHNPSDLGPFAELYNESMNRLDALDFYRFPRRYWEETAGGAQVETILCDVDYGNEHMASLLCLASENYLHAHLLGTSDLGRELKANYLAYLVAARWAQSTGRRGFHLGGGYSGEGEDLLAWKSGFCPTSDFRKFYVAKLVHDDVQYFRLSGTHSLEGFFPPWRSASR